MASTEAVFLKDQGNAFLKNNQLNEAIESYTKAIELDATNPIFFSNRAQVNIRLENYGSAIVDCDSALKLDSKMVKAMYRKGVSQMAILQYKEAQNNFRAILKILPNDRLTIENNKQCQNYLKKQAFERAIAGDSKALTLAEIDYASLPIEKTWEGPSIKVSVKVDKNEESKQPITVDLEGIDIEYLKYAIQLFKDGGRLPKLHVYAIIAKVYEILRKENTMVEVSLPHSQLENSNDDEIIVNAAKKLTVVGDTHGQFYDVLNLFQKFGFVSDEHVYLFNGDFVDRGSWSCEVALYLYILKIIYPKSIFINRGNHETNDMNKTYGFTDECEHKYSKKVFECFAESFGALPLATLINQSYLCMHGGLFSNDKITLKDIKEFNRFPDNGSTQPPRDGIAMELLWTDPQDVNGRAPSKRGIGMQFGPDITERFCLSNKIRKILRSHEVRMEGVLEEHHNRLITVFSAPNYCDTTGNQGGVVHFTENTAYNKEEDDGEGYRDVEDKNCPWNLELESFDAVPHPDLKPMAYSKSGFGF